MLVRSTLAVVVVFGHFFLLVLHSLSFCMPNKFHTCDMLCNECVELYVVWHVLCPNIWPLPFTLPAFLRWWVSIDIFSAIFFCAWNFNHEFYDYGKYMTKRVKKIDKHAACILCLRFGLGKFEGKMFSLPSIFFHYHFRTICCQCLLHYIAANNLSTHVRAPTYFIWKLFAYSFCSTNIPLQNNQKSFIRFISSCLPKTYSPFMEMFVNIWNIDGYSIDKSCMCRFLCRTR